MNIKKIDKKELQQLKNIIDTTNSMDMDSIVIDEHSCRARNEGKDVFLIEPSLNSQYFNFSKIGLKRLSTLKARMNVFDESYDLAYEETTKDTNTFISKLILKRNKTTIEFRCANPSIIDVKKNFLDPMCFSFELTEDTIKLLGKIANAMDTKNVTFMSSDGKTVNINLSDKDGDALSHVVSESVNIIDPSVKNTFSTTIKLKTLLTLLKQDRNNKKLILSVSKRGIFNLQVNGLTFYIFPEI